MRQSSLFSYLKRSLLVVIGGSIFTLYLPTRVQATIVSAEGKAGFSLSTVHNIEKSNISRQLLSSNLVGLPTNYAPPTQGDGSGQPRDTSPSGSRT